MFDIRECSVELILNNSEQLFAEHYDEICVHKQFMKLSPNSESYLQLEEAGFLMILGAFVNDELVGYSVNLISQHLHYRELKCMNNDLLFVSSKYRASPLGLKLIRLTEKKAKEIGVKMVTWHAKQDSQLSSLMQRKGYSVQDIIYSKEV